MKLTLGFVKEQIKEYGMTIRKVDGEYQVKFKGETVDKAYFTNDLADAFLTAIDMNERRVNA